MDTTPRSLPHLLPTSTEDHGARFPLGHPPRAGAGDDAAWNGDGWDEVDEDGAGWGEEVVADRVVETSRSYLCVLSRAHRGLTTAVNDALFGHQLTASQWMVLNEVVRERVADGSEVARQLAMAPSSVTEVLDRLEAKGLVRRSECMWDRRGRPVRATRAGARLAARGAVAVNRASAAALEQLDDQERRALVSMLERMSTSLRRRRVERGLPGR